MRNKTKKKILLSLTTASLFALSSGVLVACKDSDLKNKVDYEKEYDWSYVREFVDEHDEDMVIDGVLDEERWQNKNYLQFTEKGITMKYTTVFTSYGLYIGATVENDDLKWTGRYNFAGFWQNTSNNSAFGFKIQGPDVVEEHATTVFNFFVDAKNAASRNQTHFEAKATTNGDVEQGEATSMTAELFVSWDALNIDIEEGTEAPEFVRIYPAYRYVDEPSSANNKWLYPLFSEYGETRLLHRSRFDENGYMNCDQEGAVLGDAENGISKSDGWDLSQLSSGIVSSDTYHQQAIFFKGIESDSYSYTTTVKFTNESWGLNGHAGVCDMIDSEFFYAFYISGYSVTNGTTLLNFHTLNFFRDGVTQSNWHDNNEGNYSVPAGKDPYNDGIEITVIKQREKFFYFIYDDLVLCKEIPQISGTTCPGLYTLSRKAIFTDYVVTDYANDEMALNALIKQSAYKVSVPGSISGGSITSESTALVLKNGVCAEDLTISVLPNSGYILTSFNLAGTTYDGDESYRFFSENSKEGMLTIPKENIIDDVVVTAEYTYITRCGLSSSDVITVKGNIKKADGTSASNIPVFIKNDNATLCYKIMTTSTGNYSFVLPRKGTSINGVAVDGEYSLYVDGTGSGYRYLQKDIIISEEHTGDIVNNFTITKMVVGGQVYIKKQTKPSDTTGWDYSKETDDNLEVTCTKKPSAKTYFTEVTSNGYAIVETTVQNITDTSAMEYELQPGIGFIIDNGSHHLLFLLTGQRVTILPDGNWNNKVTTADTNIFNVNSGYDDEYKIRLLHYESKIVFQIFDDDEWVTLYYTVNDMYNTSCVYGFAVTSSKAPAVKFTDYSINVETAKENIVLPAGKLVIDGDLQVTLDGVEKANGDTVALGSEIAIDYTNTSSKIAKIYANNVLLGILTENQSLSATYTVDSSEVLLRAELVNEYISQGSNLMLEDENGDKVIGVTGSSKLDADTTYYQSQKIAEFALRNRVPDGLTVYDTFSVTLNLATKNVAGLLIKDNYGNFITVRLANDQFMLFKGNNGGAYRNATLASKGVVVDDSYDVMIEVREDRVLNFYIEGVLFSSQFMDSSGHSINNLGLAANAQKLEISVIWTDNGTSFGFASKFISGPVDPISTLVIEGGATVTVGGVEKDNGDKLDFGTEYIVSYTNNEDKIAEIYLNGLLVASLSKGESFEQAYIIQSVETVVNVVLTGGYVNSSDLAGTDVTDGNVSYKESAKMDEIALSERVAGDETIVATITLEIQVPTDNIAGLKIKDDKGNFITIRIFNDEYRIFKPDMTYSFRGDTLANKGITADGTYTLTITITKGRVMYFYVDGVLFSGQHMGSDGGATNLEFANDATKLEISYIWTDDNTLFSE